MLRLKPFCNAEQLAVISEAEEIVNNFLPAEGHKPEIIML